MKSDKYSIRVKKRYVKGITHGLDQCLPAKVKKKHLNISCCYERYIHFPCIIDEISNEADLFHDFI